MKPSELKSFIKEAVREAIQEELKEILLEAVRAPKTQVVESYIQPTQNQPTISKVDKKAMMESIMGDMRRGQDTMSFTSNDAVTMNTFNPQGTMAGGDLPGGNVGLDQILGLMKTNK